MIVCVLHIWIPQTLRRAGFIVEVSSLLSVTLKCFYTFKTSTSLSSWKKEILSKISDNCCQKLFVQFLAGDTWDFWCRWNFSRYFLRDVTEQRIRCSCSSYTKSLWFFIVSLQCVVVIVFVFSLNVTVKTFSTFRMYKLGLRSWVTPLPFVQSATKCTWPCWVKPFSELCVVV